MTQSPDAPQSACLVRSAIDKMIPWWTADQILGATEVSLRPAVARYLVQQGETLRSEFHSEAEAEAFWAHVGEDAATERSNFGEHGMAQVPDPCCCREHAGRGNLCPDCPEHSGE